MASNVLAEARKLQKLDFACAGITLTGTATGKRLSAFPRAWQKSRPEICMDYFMEGHNGLVLCTGEHSDILALDLDKLKDADAGILDGIQVMRELIDLHGLPQHVPIQQSGSGGQHLLFSLSKSMEQGLDKPGNQQKLRVDGRMTSIDVRGDNGCLVVYPSAYTTADGRLHEYTWLEPLGNRDSLPAMPAWLISLVNGGGEDVPRCKRPLDVAMPSQNKRRIVTATGASSDYHTLTVATVEEAAGQIAHSWARPNGYDFAPVDRGCACHLCRQMHTSNNYICRRIISTCFYLSNYSSRCCSKVFGTSEVMALKALLAAPTSDDRVVKVLQLVTKDAGHELKYTGKQWLCFQGLIWEPLTDLEVKQRIKLDVNYDVLETLIKIMRHRKKWEKENGMPEDREVTSTIEALIKCNRFLMKASNINSVAETAKQLLLDVDIAGQLDVNKDILACESGVIDLQTGAFRKGTSLDYLSRRVKADYHGLQAPTPIVDALFHSIFNADLQVIDYVQRLLGYAITGHTSSQKLALFTGGGSNGKSLLLGCLNNLLGPTMYCTPAREVFFESGRQTTAGGHTAHLAPLVGKLIVAREELNKSDRLDVALIKIMTGEGDIVSRAPYSSEYVTFKPTHLPILACNSLPPIDVDDEATLRRLVVVPFVNTYLGPDDRVRYDPTNPHHRKKDPQLKDKLATQAALDQFLTWLVRGAVEWYEKGLSDMPALLRQGLDAYISENDVLDQFIQEECEVHPDATLNAGEFRQRFVDRGQKIQQKLLTPKMAKRGFPFKNTKICGTQTKVFCGLRWTTQQ